MISIEKKESLYNPNILQKKSYSLRSLNNSHRLSELRKINDENKVTNSYNCPLYYILKGILKRLQSASSKYNVNKLVDDNEKQERLKRNIS